MASETRTQGTWRAMHASNRGRSNAPPASVLRAEADAEVLTLGADIGHLGEVEAHRALVAFDLVPTVLAHCCRSWKRLRLAKSAGVVPGIHAVWTLRRKLLIGADAPTVAARQALRRGLVGMPQEQGMSALLAQMRRAPT